MARSSFFLLCLVACGDSQTIVDGRVVDDVAVEGGSSCNPVTQGGCGEGQKCTLIEDGATCSSDGTLASGTVCNVDDDQCVRGTGCVEGYCREYCVASRCDTAPEYRCESGLCTSHAITTCSVACDPLSPTCGSGQECYLPFSGGCETPGCLKPGAVQVGDACAFPNDCASGLTCAGETVATLGYPTCRKRCLTAAPNCDGQDTCVERKSGDGYGVCITRELDGRRPYGHPSGFRFATDVSRS